VLDKVTWAMTLAYGVGWKIFVDVSRAVFLDCLFGADVAFRPAEEVSPFQRCRPPSRVLMDCPTKFVAAVSGPRRLVDVIVQHMLDLVHRLTLDNRHLGVGSSSSNAPTSDSLSMGAGRGQVGEQSSAGAPQPQAQQLLHSRPNLGLLEGPCEFATNISGSSQGGSALSHRRHWR